MSSQTSKAGQRQQRTEIFHTTTANLSGSAFTTTGIDEGTYHATAKKTGTGVIALQLTKAYARVPVVTASAEHATAKLFPVIAGNTIGGLITINIFSDAGTATDPTGLHIHVVGSDVIDQI